MGKSNVRDVKSAGKIKDGDLPEDKELTRRKVLQKISDARTELVMLYPFYGSILMNLRVALADCGTAATDMRRIIFDPQFVLKLSMEELQFVMMHEVMHNVLKHCVRWNGKLTAVYNVAADIVVNSNIMNSLGISGITICGCEVMHKTPDGKEGYKYSAEEVYEMLMRQGQSKSGGDESLQQPGSGSADSSDGEQDADTMGCSDNSGNASIDRHDLWGRIENGQEAVDKIDRMVVQAVKDSLVAGSSDMPMAVRNIVDDLSGAGRVNWIELLHDFIQITNDRNDYSFNPTDRRYSDSEFLLPAFNEVEGNSVDNIWFVVDTSASIEDETLGIVYSEIRSAISQFTSLSASLSFFDTSVTEPVEFDDVDSLSDIKPVGGGGTSFRSIFRYMADNMQEILPTAIVIMTDGYADWPEEKMTQGIPVMWIIIDTDREPPWGVVVHI